MTSISYPGELAALLTAILWTVSSLSFSAAARQVGSLSVNLIRLALAWAFLALEGLLFRGLPFPTDASGRTWLWLTVSGFIGFFLGDLCLMKALLLIGPRLATLLMSFAPPLAALGGILVLEERLRTLNWLGMLVTILGVSWVALERQPGRSGDRRSSYAAGVALGVLAALGQAVGAVLSKYGMGDYDPFAATQIRALTGLLGFTVLLHYLRWYPRVAETLKNRRALGQITLGALTGPFLGVSLFLLSLKYIPTGVAQTIVSIVPVLIIPFVIVIDKERVSLRALAGAVVAVGGVALLFWR